MQTWLQYCKSQQAAYPVIPEVEDWGKVDPYHLIDALSTFAREDDVIVPGASSTCAQIIYQAWRVKDGQRFTYMGALGAMGTGLPAAIGAALATGRRVISVIGDGGFMLNVQELEVVARVKLPIKFFILSNGGYGAIMNTQRAYFDGRFVGANKDSGLTLPDIRKVALAFGIDWQGIDRNRWVMGDIAQIMGDNAPIIVECITEPEFQPLHRVGRKMVDGNPVSMDFGEVE